MYILIVILIYINGSAGFEPFLILTEKKAPFSWQMGLLLLLPCLVLCLVHKQHFADGVEFLGGSMNFEAYFDQNGDVYADAKVLTGWRLGTGPCGPNCNKTMISTDTMPTRNKILTATGDKKYFGEWNLETQEGTQNPNPIDVTDTINGALKEKVMSLNEIAKWEIETAEVTLNLSKTAKYTDFIYEGHNWTTLSIQPKIRKWHMQLKINAKRRSDTLNPNNSPVVQIRPFLRLGINKTYNLSIPTIDPDGDYFQCRLSGFIEFLEFAKGPKLQNLKVQKNCFILLTTSEPQYHVGDSGVIAITIQDFNRENIKLEGDDQPFRPRYGTLSLSSVPVQPINTEPVISGTLYFIKGYTVGRPRKLYFEILAVVNEPIFIDPTPPERQLFTVFVGADLEIKVLAKPTDNTRTITDFYVESRDGIVPKLSQVAGEIQKGPLVKSQTVHWIPKASDTGDHFLCVRAQDSDGFDSLPRCFIIRVKVVSHYGKKCYDNPSVATFLTADAQAGTGTTIPGKPVFLKFPRNGDISCMVESICRVPIYAQSTASGGITGIEVTHSDIAGTSAGPLQNGSSVSPGAKKVDVSFQGTKFGKKQICLKAKDANTEIEQCFEAVVQPLDPCEIRPCLNSGQCVTSQDKTTFSCKCFRRFSGQKCETPPANCTPNFCVFGNCSLMMPTHSQWCTCVAGYTGIHCENKLDNCVPDLCGPHGVCEDLHVGYKCHCQPGFTGANCSVPSSATVNPCANSGVSGCDCGSLCQSPSGICTGQTGSRKCLCSIGFSDTNCQKLTTFPGNIPKFVKPTPEEDAIIKCEESKYDRQECVFSVYTSPDTSGSYGPTVSPVLPPDEVTITISSPSDPKIPGIPNVFLYTLTITRRNTDTAPKVHVCLQVFSTTKSYPTDTKCFNVIYIGKRVADSSLPAPVLGNNFVSPTMPDDSEVICEIGKPCHFLVYASKDNNVCKQVLASDTMSVTVFNPIESGSGACMTNIAYDVKSSVTEGFVKKLCLKSGDNGDSRCFNLRMVAKIIDHCLTNPCENGGICGSNQGHFTCICKAGFTGLRCEKGPCPVTSPTYCKNGGYCFAIGSIQNCFCTLGYMGNTCSDQTKNTVTDPKHNGAVYKDGSIPKEVKCYVGQPCHIPTVLIGDPAVSPIVSPGYKDGNVDIHGTTLSPDPSSPSNYHASTELVSKTSGKHKVCMQTLNTVGQSADEVCFIVNTINGPPALPSTLHAYYVDPTMPDTSSIECQRGQPCHLSLWMRNFNGDDSCPTVKASDSAESGVYVHQSIGSSTPTKPCKADVVFQTNTSTVYNRTCFTVTSTKQSKFGGDGETRCFKVTIVDKLTAKGSCATVHCENGGFCDGHKTTAKCVCRSGYSGAICNQGNGESFTNPRTNSSATPIPFGDFAVPKNIKCYLHTECQIPFAITNSTGTSPILQLGHVDNGLTVTPPSITTGTYQSKVSVMGDKVGNHKMCVQSSSIHSSTVSDEICFDVDVTAPSSALSSSKDQPHFIQPTIPPNSTLECQSGKTCHILLHLSSGSNIGCPTVDQTQGSSEDLHMFHSNSSSGNDSCAVDITLTPPTNKHGTDKLCFDLSMPNIPGESRCIIVDYANITSGPCQGVSCLNGGVCGQNGKCICSLHHSGPMCGKDGSQGPDHTSDPPQFTEMALPTNVKCQINKECKIPLMINGDKSTLPMIHVGHIDPGLNVKSPNLLQTPTLPSGSHQISLPVRGTQAGSKQICVQTKQLKGSALDEHCFTVNITNPGSSSSVPPNQPLFEQPTLPDDSTVLCNINKTCHVILHQVPDFTNGCPSVSTDSVPGNLYVLKPKSPINGTCQTDVVFTPSEQQDAKVCLSAMKNSVVGEKRCYTIHVPASHPPSTPCESKPCKNGGLCTGNPATNTTHCICPVGYTNVDCGTESAHKIGDTSGTLVQPSVGTNPVFTDTVVPDTVQCVVSTVCHVPFLITGNPNHTPLFAVIHDLDSQDVHATVSNPPHHVTGHPMGTYTAGVAVSSSSVGTHIACVQTVGTTGNNVQTVCFKVNVTSHGGVNTNHQKQIVEPSLPDESVIKCVKDKPCHVLIHTNQTGSNCNPQVQESGAISGKIDIFPPVKDLNGSCITDIKLSSTTVGTQHLCLQASSYTGTNTESRCYTVNVVQDNCTTLPCNTNHGTCQVTSGSPTCQCNPRFKGITCNTDDVCLNVTCQNGGTCIIRNNTHFCLCFPGKTGPLCASDGSIPIPGAPNNASTDPVFVHTVLPKLIVCTVGQQCLIPLPVGGPNITNTSVQFGHIGNGITPGKVDLDPTPLMGNQHLAQFHFTPNIPGDKHICLQTTTSTKNVDEVCLIVDSRDPSTTVATNLDPNTPQFQPPSLPDNSIVECEAEKTCYIYLTTTPGTNNTCPDVKQSSNGQLINLHVFNTNATSSSGPNKVCRSIVALVPTVSETGDQHVCLKPTVAGKQGRDKCFTVTVTSPSTASEGGPCQKKHCLNKGICNGDFTSASPKADCVCTGTGYTGTFCELGNCGQKTDFAFVSDAARMGRATCRCSLENGNEVTVIKKRPKATPIQLLKAAGIGAGCVSGAIAIATVIYFIVGKIKKSCAQNNKTERGYSSRIAPKTPKPRIHPSKRH